MSRESSRFFTAHHLFVVLMLLFLMYAVTVRVQWMVTIFFTWHLYISYAYCFVIIWLISLLRNVCRLWMQTSSFKRFWCYQTWQFSYKTSIHLTYYRRRRPYNIQNMQKSLLYEVMLWKTFPLYSNQIRILCKTTDNGMI